MVFLGKPKSREACVKQLSELASKNAAFQTDPAAAAEYQKQLASANAQQSVNVDTAKAEVSEAQVRSPVNSLHTFSDSCWLYTDSYFGLIRAA